MPAHSRERKLTPPELPPVHHGHVEVEQDEAVKQWWAAATLRAAAAKELAEHNPSQDAHDALDRANAELAAAMAARAGRQGQPRR